METGLKSGQLVRSVAVAVLLLHESAMLQQTLRYGRVRVRSRPMQRVGAGRWIVFCVALGVDQCTSLEQLLHVFQVPISCCAYESFL